jgi:ferredoxin
MIFYFSASGNSQHVAERIASELGEKLISIGVAMRDGHFEYDASNDSHIGFVVPTFAGTLPGIVADFIAKANIAGHENKYIFGAFTCGAGTGNECAALRLALEEKGYGFNGGFDVVMPDNYIVWSNVPSEGMLKRKLAGADSVVDKIIATIKSGKNGYIDTSAPDMPFFPYENVDSENGIGKLYADDKCTGCGECAKMCPTGTITVKDGHAQFKGQCCVCFTCLHRCPSHAVQFGSATVPKGRYQYPGTTFKTRNDY